MRKSAAALLLAACAVSAQNRPPVIDIHVHTLGGLPGVGPMCPFNPQFLASDPKSTEGPIGWAKQDCTFALEASKTPADYMKDVIAEYERAERHGRGNGRSGLGEESGRTPRRRA